MPVSVAAVTSCSSRASRRRCGILQLAVATVGLITLLTRLAAAQGAAAAAPPGDESLLFADLAKVVGASRYEEDTRDAAASITIITAEDIARYGYRTLGEALASVRGFVVTGDRNYSYLGVRGFAVPGDYNSRVLFLVDGHRLNESVFGATNLETAQAIDLRVVERIEIVRGPSSSVYGTSALFGVVNIVTRQARWLQGAEVGGSVASYGSRRASVAYGRKFGDGAELYLFGSGFASTGQNLYFPEFNAPATHDGVAVGADGDRYSRAFAKLTWADFTVQAGYSDREKHIPTGSYGTRFDDPRARTKDERAFGLLRYSHGFADVSRLEVTLSWDGAWYRGWYPYADGLFSDYGRAGWWTLEGQYVWPLGAHHRLVAGGEARWNAIQDQGGDNLDSATVIFRSRRNGALWGLFVQDEWRVAPRLLASVGLRHDEDETFGGTTNPRLALVYTVGARSAVKLLYGRAFRAPTAYELDYQDGGLSTKAPGSLKPETVESYEAVFEGVPTPGLRLTASAFHLHLSDLVTQIRDWTDGLLVFRNGGGARSSGLEFEADVRLAAGANVRATYTYCRAQDAVTGQQRPNAPRHLATASVSVPLFSERTRASFATRYIGGQTTSAGAWVGAHTVTDATVLISAGAQRVTLSAGVYNLFDVSYSDPAGSEQVVMRIPQDRRNVRVGVQVKW